MQERLQRPRQPEREDLVDEIRSETVQTASRNEMSERLSHIGISEKAKAEFFPMLLKYADKFYTTGQVCLFITLAITNYTKQNPDIFERLQHNVPKIIDAMITDPEAQEEAKSFYYGSVHLEQTLAE